MKRLLLSLAFVLSPLPIAAQEPAQTAPKDAALSVLRFGKFDIPERPGEDVGVRVATTLGLQAWITLYRTPASDPAPTSSLFVDQFGSLPRNLKQAVARAEELHRAPGAGRSDAPLLLWGDAFSYGNGIVVKANLTVLNHGMGKLLREQIWSVNLDRRKQQHSIVVGLPEFNYEFAPIVLRADLPPETANALDYPVFRDKDRSAMIGQLGTRFTLKGREGDFIAVRLEGDKKGYVYSPKLSKVPNEVVSFTGGLLRILRSDWKGAQIFFQEVAGNEKARVAIRSAAFVYLGFVNAMNKDTHYFSILYMEQAYKLNPYLRSTVQFLVMAHLDQLSRMAPTHAEGKRGDEIVRKISEILSKNSALFAVNDPWLVKVKQAIQ